jgi:hypothetical protein
MFGIVVKINQPAQAVISPTNSNRMCNDETISYLDWYRDTVKDKSSRTGTGRHLTYKRYYNLVWVRSNLGWGLQHRFSAVHNDL